MSITKLSKKHKYTDECETSQRDEIFHIEKRIAREILEGCNGERRVRELETSTSNNKSFSQTQITRYREVAQQTLEHLNIVEPAKIANHSHVARRRICDIESERSDFYRRYPHFTIIHNEPQKQELEQLAEALEIYMAAPLVDFTWQEILNAEGTFRVIDFERILINKLVWNAVYSPICKDDPSTARIVNDQTGRITLETFDVEEHTATVLLTVACADDFKLHIKLKDVDPFLLMLIPDAKSQIRIRNFTRSLATDIISSEQ